MNHAYLSISMFEDMGFYWTDKNRILCGSNEYKGFRIPMSRIGGLYYSYFGKYTLDDHIAMITKEYNPDDDVNFFFFFGKDHEY